MLVVLSTDQKVPCIHSFPLTGRALPPETLGMPRIPTSRSGKPWLPAFATPASTSASSTVRLFLQPNYIPLIVSSEQSRNSRVRD